MERDVTVNCGGVLVRPGDLVFGDVDGVVVIPREREEEVITAALAKIGGENHTREELAKGAKLAEVFAKYGVL
jgi:regulator of RNase E activity RraA